MIAADGSQAGIMTRFEALSLAQTSELDLVEVSPMAEPPVVRIMDFGKYLFEQKKNCLLYTSPSPRDGLLSRMPSSA